MKTLLEKLNPEVLAKMEADKEKYPGMIDGILTRLSKIEFWLDLTIMDLTTIQHYTDGSLISSIKLSKVFDNE